MGEIMSLKATILAAVIAVLALTTVPVPTLAATTLPEQAEPPVWTITKPNGHKIHILGDFMVLVPGMEWKTTPVATALAEADVLVVEQLWSEIQDRSAMARIERAGTATDGITMRERMTPEQRTLFEQACAAVGFPAQIFDDKRPWFVSTALSSLMFANAGLVEGTGPQFILQGEFIDSGRKVVAFETMDEIISIVQRIADEDALADIEHSSRIMLERPQFMLELLALWARGDLAALDAEVAKIAEATPAEVSKLLWRERQAAWAKRIASEFMSDTNDYLIVLTYFHFSGEENLLTELRKAGLTVVGPN